MENKEMMPDPYSMPELKIWNISEPTMMNNKKFEKLETREDVSIKNYAKNKIKKFWLSGKLYEEKTVITILAREWSEWVSNYRANFVYGLEKESIIAPIKVMMFNTEMIEVHVYEEQKTNNSKPSDLELRREHISFSGVDIRQVVAGETIETPEKITQNMKVIADNYYVGEISNYDPANWIVK